MSCFLVYYKGVAKMMRPVKDRDEYIALRNKPSNVEYTTAARMGNPEAKRRMIQFNYSCLPAEGGKLKGAKTVSNSVGMDIDFAKDMPKEELESAMKIMIGRVLNMKEDLGLLMLERSATKGLHIVFRRIGWLSQEENLEWAQKMLGVEFDKGAKDITRVFFTPTASQEDLLYLHEDLFVNEESKPTDRRDGLGCGRPARTSPKTEAKSEEKTEAKSDGCNVVSGGETCGEGGGLRKGACETPTPPAPTPPAAAAKADPPTGGQGGLYIGIAYSAIVTEFLRQFNNGQTPVEGNREVMTYELAKALRSICDYNLDFMTKVIPRYSGLPEDEYRHALQNALDEPRRGVSYKLTKVLEALYVKERKKQSVGTADFEAENELPPQMPQRLPFPLGLLSSKVPEMYRAAVCEAVFAPLSTYVHGVKFRYWDGVEHEPTFMSVLCAPMSIGKGCVRKPISIILDELVKKDATNRARESEWKQKNPSAKQKRDPRPTDICIQVLIDNLTDAVFNQRVSDADKNGQRFLYTSVDELDTLKNITSKGTTGEVSVLIRKAFDNALHGQERVGADSVTGIAPLRFNFNASTTNRNFLQFFSRELTNGTITRLSMSTIIKPDDMTRPVYKDYDAAYHEEVRELTRKLSLLSGEISCPKCNKLALALCEEHDKLASLYGSEAYEVLNKRAVVIAWLKGMMLYVMNGQKWTKEIQEYVEWSLRYDLWVKMRIMGKVLEDALREDSNVTSSRGPINMLAFLPDEFSIEDLYALRKKMGKSIDKRLVKNQLLVWRKRKLVDFEDFNSTIKKVKAPVKNYR